MTKHRLKSAFPTPLPMLQLIQRVVEQPRITGQGASKSSGGQRVISRVVKAFPGRLNPIGVARFGEVANVAAAPAGPGSDPEFDALGINHRSRKGEAPAHVAAKGVVQHGEVIRGVKRTQRCIGCPFTGEEIADLPESVANGPARTAHVCGGNPMYASGGVWNCAPDVD